MSEYKTKIYETLGQASMAWSETPKGVFKSELCIELGEKLLADYEALEARLKEAEDIVIKCAFGLGGELQNKMQAKEYCAENNEGGEIFKVDIDEYRTKYPKETK
jgi:hypothetical protein